MSNHPVSRAITNYYSTENLPVREFKEEHGLGISGIINEQKVSIGRYKWIQEIDKTLTLNLPSSLSMSVVAIDGQFAGFIKLEDRLRAESLSVVSSLMNKFGRKVKVISGDLNNHVKKTCPKTGNLL